MVGPLCKSLEQFPHERTYSSPQSQINDVHHAAIYGRPPHINPDFSDIIPLAEEDFQDYEYSPFTVVDEPLSYESKLYLINLAGLSCRGKAHFHILGNDFGLFLIYSRPMHNCEIFFRR